MRKTIAFLDLLEVSENWDLSLVMKNGEIQINTKDQGNQVTMIDLDHRVYEYSR